MANKQQKSIFWHTAYLLKPEIRKFYSTSPGAPSIGECKTIEKFIVSRRKKSPKILILGSTPRFRDLAHSLKAEVTCVDISIDMLQAMINLMKYKKAAEKEIWIRSDWLKMPIQKNYWDFVLGDLVTCNLPYKIWDNFFKKIKEILKPDSFFISREWPIRSVVKDKNKLFLQVLEEFRGRTEFKNIVYLGWKLLHLVFDTKTREISTSRIHKIVARVINTLPDKSLKKDLKHLAEV